MGFPSRNALIRAAVLAAIALIGATADAASRTNVGLNQSLRIGVNGSAANVVISNATVADVTVVDAHSVIVQGKSYGTTQIMVFDTTGRLLLDSVVTVTAPAEGLVTLYRGGVAQQYNCSPRCEADTSRASGGSTAASSAPAS
jgi:Flp pilus assembly secretin CpaC